MERCQTSARILLLVASLHALSETPPTTIPIRSRLITSGLNCSLAVGIDRKLLFWGELSSVQHKAVSDDPEASSPKGSPLHKPKGCSSLPTPVSINDIEVHYVSAGAEHVLLLSSDGRLFTWGKNRYGQCGLGHLEPVLAPCIVEGDWNSTVSLSAGQFHSAVLCTGGDSLFTWGWGFYGQLGHGGESDRTANRIKPLKVQHLPEQLREVRCGRVHSIVLSKSGRVWVVGGGTYGQLGTMQDIMKQFSWIEVDFGCDVPPIVIIETSFYHTVAVAEDNRVFEWGKNPAELQMKMFVMRRLRNANDKAKEGDKVNSKPLPMTIPKDFLGIVEVEHSIDDIITSVSTGLSHSALLTISGHLYTWGKASALSAMLHNIIHGLQSLDFQLGHGTKTEKGEPARVTDPEGVVWSTLHCGWN